MAEVSLKIKVLPKSPEEDLEELKEEVEKILNEANAIEINSIEEEPIAFGLKALIVTLVWPEEQETEMAEEALKKNEKVSSTEILDYSRTMT